MHLNNCFGNLGKQSSTIVNVKPSVFITSSFDTVEAYDGCKTGHGVSFCVFCLSASTFELLCPMRCIFILVSGACSLASFKRISPSADEVSTGDTFALGNFPRKIAALLRGAVRLQKSHVTGELDRQCSHSVESIYFPKFVREPAICKSYRRYSSYT
jgi:hypothetical protein